MQEDNLIPHPCQPEMNPTAAGPHLRIDRIFRIDARTELNRTDPDRIRRGVIQPQRVDTRDLTHTPGIEIRRNNDLGRYFVPGQKQHPQKKKPFQIFFFLLFFQLQQHFTQLLATMHRIAMIEQKRLNAECTGRLQIGRTIIDKKRPSRIEPVAIQQYPINLRFGFHRPVFTGDDLPVEETVDRFLAKERDILFRHVGEDIQTIPMILQGPNQIPRRWNLLLPND